MRTIDLFSGCGGMSLGFAQAGFTLCAAVDNWKPAQRVYARNFDHPIFGYDLSDANNVVERISAFTPEMIIGGPPCQDFSSAGKRSETGERADLTQSFAKIVVTLKPCWFVMENVARAGQSCVFQDACDLLRDAGYGLTMVCLNAEYCGVPQMRKRLFLIGELGGREAALHEPLLKGLSLQPLTVRRYLESINYPLDIEHYYRHPRSYARRGVFSVDEPSATIRGVNRPVPPNYRYHPGDTAAPDTNLRPLTTRERAILQTFPPDFVLFGNKSEQEQMIGNAVPPKLAEYVAHAVLQCSRNPECTRKVVPESLQTRTVQLELW